MNKLINNILSVFTNRTEVINIEKNKIRLEVRDLKNQISETQKLKDADLVFQKIELFPEFITSTCILLYWSTPNELPTHEIVENWSSKKIILLPTVMGDDLILKQYISKGKMKQGSLGIWEPDLSENYVGKIDLVIVPGVAFDLKKNRLGRGKGFYDRFLKNYTTLKIGVGFDFQLYDSIPSTKLDIGMDKIVTPSKVIK